jgi:hypothetical protein
MRGRQELRAAVGFGVWTFIVSCYSSAAFNLFTRGEDTSVSEAIANAPRQVLPIFTTLLAISTFASYLFPNRQQEAAPQRNAFNGNNPASSSLTNAQAQQRVQEANLERSSTGSSY